MGYLFQVLLRGTISVVVIVCTMAVVMIAGAIGSIGDGPFLLVWMMVIGLAFWVFMPRIDKSKDKPTINHDDVDERKEPDE